MGEDPEVHNKDDKGIGTKMCEETLKELSMYSLQKRLLRPEAGKQFSIFERLS